MKKSLMFLACISMALGAFSQGSSIGFFDKAMDIGNPKVKGKSEYDAVDQTYILKGGGDNIGPKTDEFHFLPKKLTGNFILKANFEFSGQRADSQRKAGLMIRESEDDNAAHISAVLHGDGLTVLQWRNLQGTPMHDLEDKIFAPKKSYQVIQLEREGKKITMKAAGLGEPLQVIGTKEMSELKDEVLAGLFISSHNEEALEEVKVWNVRITKPVETESPDEGIQPSSRIETMNVFDGKRKIVYESETRFEAPNWMPDGKTLLFNESGSLYTIPMTGGTPKKINTGTADRNNNDHGISFDGKTLAISHHRSGLPGGGSTIYILPLEGGTPKMLTEKTPSYWHGWAPNNKEVVYVGQRGTNFYDIYKMPISGGKEVKLTDNNGFHVDGPEYSPDGKYIYYNGSQTGTMQIWRMKPDGSTHEQLTFDETNDWFPHISPDGKWIVYLSFPADIDPVSHPANKKVELKLMPVSGGAPKVIAYLYGGQGTINVPSWSPDSKEIAFVSYF